MTSDSADLAHITEGIGERWEVLNNAYKPYPCGVVLFPVIDACLELRAGHAPVAGSIERVVVRGHPLMRERAHRPNVENGRDAKVSLQHIVAAAFLSDTWLATVDAVSRIHTDCLYGFFPQTQAVSVRAWYLIFLSLLTAITAATMGFAEPGPLILLSAVIGFLGTVLFSTALIFLNHVYLPQHLPSAARPGRVNLIFLCVSCLAYLLLAIAYILTVTGVIQ